MNTSPDLLGRAAIWYAQRGLPVFPCHKGGKTPITEHGLNDASRDPEAIRRWWEQTPQANIGLPTGAASGVFALDVDGPEGESTLARLIEANGPIPDTWEQRTGRGRHVLFAYPKNGAAIRNSAGKLGAGLDIRGEGGYVIVPPSVHPSGHLYKWQETHTPSGRKIAEAPEWFLDLVKYKAPPLPEPRTKWQGNGSTANTRYVEAALEDESKAVANAPEGQRNDTLNRASHNLGQLVGGGSLSRETAESELTRAALHAGLPQIETARTIKSGLDAGGAKPREIPEAKTSPHSEQATIPDKTSRPKPARSPPFTPEMPELPDLVAGDVARWQGREPEPLVFTVDELVPEGMVTLLVSEGGAGKSILMQTACTCIAGGLPFLRRETATGKSAGIFAEDPEAVLHHRQGRINDTLDIDIEALAGQCFIQSYSGHDATLWSDGAPTPFMGRLEGELSRIDGLRFVALDNAALLYSGNENDRCEVTSFINRLNGMAERLGVGIVLTTHVSKSTDGSTLRVASGSTAWLNASRAVLELTPEKDDQPPTFKVRKSNHTRPGLEIQLEWRDGVLMPAAQLDSFQASARDHEIERLILEKVVAAWDEKTPLSDIPQASARYLPKVLCRNSEFKIKELRQYMEALQDGGFIKMAQASSRTPRGLRVVQYPDRPGYQTLKDAMKQGNGDVEVAS